MQQIDRASVLRKALDSRYSFACNAQRMAREIAASLFDDAEISVRQKAEALRSSECKTSWYRERRLEELENQIHDAAVAIDEYAKEIKKILSKIAG